MAGLKARLQGLFVGALFLSIMRLIVDGAPLGLAGFAAVESGQASTASMAWCCFGERHTSVGEVTPGFGGAAAQGAAADSWVVLAAGRVTEI